MQNTKTLLYFMNGRKINPKLITTKIHLFLKQCYSVYENKVL